MTPAFSAVPIDGTWSASADAMGGTLTLLLSTKQGAVTGTGSYTVGALRAGTLTVSGTAAASRAVLVITYDHGETVTFVTTRITAQQMHGQLTYRSGSVQNIGFVRP